jgi:integrase
MPELFRVLFCCGLRIGEALKLRVQDVDLQRGIITVRQGKFRRDRLVPMAPALTQRLRVYARRIGARGPERPFFVSRKGDVLTYDTAREVFIELLGRAGIACEGPRRPTLHSARHTFASHRLQGHEDLRTTSIYARTNLELQRAALEKADSGISARPLRPRPPRQDLLLMLRSM